MSYQINSYAEAVFIDRKYSKYYWSPQSQLYAPANILEALLASHWIPVSCVTVTQFPLASYRQVNVYTFTLQQDHSFLEISVIENPVVLRLIRTHDLEVQ